MSGKVKYGETIIETAERELFEETHLTGKAELAGIRHYHVRDNSTKEIVEDKFLFFCTVIEPVGKLRANNEGSFKWIYEEDFEKVITNHFESFETFLEDVKLAKDFNGVITFVEYDQFTDKF